MADYLSTQGGLPGQQYRQSPDPPAGAHAPPRFRCRFSLRSRMIVLALRLEEDRVLRVPPEVRHRVAAMAAARQYLEAAGTLAVRARLALLLLPRLRAVGR